MRQNPTPAERLLWQRLRNWQIDGLKFRRQTVIGRYIADFYCSSAALVIEVDGATHVAARDDAARDAWFATQGLRVLRFWNNEVMGNIEGVLQAILLAARTPPPGPLPQGEGENVAPSPCGIGLGKGSLHALAGTP